MCSQFSQSQYYSKWVIVGKLEQCVIPENIQTSPTEGIFSKTPPPLWKFQLSFIHFFKFVGLTEPPAPQEIPIPSVGGVWIFSGTAQLRNNTTHDI